MNHRRFITVAVVITAIAVLWPHTARANLFGLDPVGELLGLIISLLEITRTLFTGLLAGLGAALSAIIQQPELNYGGAAVYQVWKMLRDTCNMLFIVLFIAIAFGTIFNTVRKNSFFYGTALLNVVIAAIAINFSLAVGQTVVWAGNAASGLVISLTKGVDVGAEIAIALQVPKVALGKTTAPISTIPDLSSPMSQLTPSQQIAVQTWAGNPKTAFDNCLKYNQAPVAECYDRSVKIQGPVAAAAADREMGRLAQTPGLMDRLKDAGNFWLSAGRGALSGAASTINPLNPVSVITLPGSAIIGAVRGATSSASIAPPKSAGKPSYAEQARTILDMLLNIFLIMVLDLSFLAVIVFMVIRIPTIWFLLAVSAGAFFSIALPNSEAFVKWWKNLVGWCIFSPLYLLVIYIGLYFLSQQGTLMSGFQNAAFLSGMLGTILFYAITGFIFIGGAKFAMDTAFALSPAAGKAFKSIGGALWMGGESGAVGAVYRGTGLQANVQALGERAQQMGRDTTAGLRGRAPTLFGTEEEKRFAAQKRWGVRGGAAEFEKATATQIGNERSALEIEIKRRQAEAAARGTIFDDAAFLQQQAKSGNRNLSLAANELLMSKGKLDAAGMKKTAEDYGKISPIARQGYIERVSKQLEEKATKKEFKDPAEALASLDVLNPKQKEKFLKTLERNQPLIAGELAGQGFYLNAAGARRSPAEIIEGNFPAMENKDVLKLLDQGRANPAWTSPDVERLIGGRMRKLDQYLNLVRNADPTQQADIARILAAHNIHPRP